FSSRRRHTRSYGDWSSDVCSSDLIKVLPDLTLPGHPEVFAVGDMAALGDLPGVAEVAMQGSLHAANTIRHRLLGRDNDHVFKYRSEERRVGKECRSRWWR